MVERKPVSVGKMVTEAELLAIERNEIRLGYVEFGNCFLNFAILHI
jgi:hypothetical protein